ncbi:uncharacterized protein SCHCODRAFT_02552744 [Schizophyllum commune H4-8]|nr:uncharacterized protein SCHCODRAFT_02552744 [Schizophyllum commune H4-8]KAI5887635.1 hypothetical protein SCHCODRAFT_02552744 [Schizophyllum commune H4-8]
MGKLERKARRQIALAEKAATTTLSSSGPFPINHLATEVFETILLLTLPDALANPTSGSHIAYKAYLNRCDSIDYPRLLSRVCRKWRDVVDGCPALWSYICIDVDAFDAGFDYYNTVLARSGDHPLSLSFIVSTGKTNEVRRALNGPVFAAHLQRLRRLSVQTFFVRDHSERPLEGPELLPLVPAIDTPLLERLRIDCNKAAKSMVRYLRKLSLADNDNVPANLRIVCHAPRLREFVLEGLDMDTILPHVASSASSYFSLHKLELAGLKWSIMTRLRLPDIGRRVTDLLRVLKQATRLVELRCAVFEDREDQRAQEGGNEHAKLDLPLVFPELVTLHLVLIPLKAADGGVYDDDENPEKRTGLDRFLGALVTPALTSLSITRRGEPPNERDDQDWNGVYGRVIGTNGKPKDKLHPHLQAFLNRSTCTLTSLALANLVLYPPELFRVLLLVPAVHTLHLKDAIRQMGAEFWAVLGQRGPRGRPVFVPCLRRLVVRHDLGDAAGSTFTSEDVAEMVNARWKAGRGGGARIEVVHRRQVHQPSRLLVRQRKGLRHAGQGGQEGPNMRFRHFRPGGTELPAPREVASNVELERTQARDDLELVYVEIPEGTRTEREECLAVLRKEESMSGRTEIL